MHNKKALGLFAAPLLLKQLNSVESFLSMKLKEGKQIQKREPEHAR